MPQSQSSPEVRAPPHRRTRDTGGRWARLVALCAAALVLPACGPAMVEGTETTLAVTAQAEVAEQTSSTSDTTTSSLPASTTTTSQPPPPTTTQPPPPTTTQPSTTTTGPPPPPGQFSSWVGGGDPGPCDPGISVPEPPHFGVGYGATTVAVGALVNLCFLGFGIKTPVVVEATGPDDFRSTFEVWVGTNNASDPLSDPLAGVAMNTPDGTVSWVWRSTYPTGTYTFTARQGDLSLSSVVDVAIGERLWIQTLEPRPAIGDVARFAISGAGPDRQVPLWVFRDTGVLDEDHPEGCDLCSIFELFRELEPVAADESGAAVVGLAIDNDYEQQPDKEPSPIFNAFCLITSLTEPVCDAFAGGWFDVRR